MIILDIIWKYRFTVSYILPCIYCSYYVKFEHYFLKCLVSETINFSMSNLRYKNDVYDRMCYPYIKWPNSVPINTSSDIDIQNNNDSYRLPPEVLRTAVQPSNGDNSLIYDSPPFYNTGNMCFCFHFGEISKLTHGKKREFIISVYGGTDTYTSEPITLDHLKPLSICLNRRIEGHFRFVISATTRSDLPPILNAFELHNVIPQSDLHEPTNSRDGKYLYLIILFLFFLFKVLKVWGW